MANVNEKDVVRIGERRAAQAARMLERRLGAPAEPLCVLRRVDGTRHGARGDAPVGRKCFVDVRVRRDAVGRERAWVVIVDEIGTVKAASEQAYEVLDAVMCARSLGLPIAESKNSELRMYLSRPQKEGRGTPPTDHSYIRWGF